MKFLKRINDSLTAMIVIVIFSLLFVAFAYMGSINLTITLIVIVAFVVIACSFLLGEYVQAQEIKKTDSAGKL
ncbi:hypothetical protein JZO76_00030 [Enterococcus sp. MJM12]|uniref:Uncharacterized protein n=1 Tax=Candidatus Enterococcus myersii TaxID=2815322 RepID=A0ABS3H4Q8_9ENTE|nr:hypothetical protein [Enterococcus sp. MJM12]MBO0447915.1 hypothetical protein [Enterococcus sp. MJM12]